MQELVEIGNCGEKFPTDLQIQNTEKKSSRFRLNSCVNLHFTSNNVMTIDFFFFSMTSRYETMKGKRQKTQRWSQIRRTISNKILKYHFSRWYLIPIEIMFPNTLVALFHVSFSLTRFFIFVFAFIRRLRFNYYPSISHVENKLPPRSLHMTRLTPIISARLYASAHSNVNLIKHGIKIPRQITGQEKNSRKSWKNIILIRH